MPTSIDKNDAPNAAVTLEDSSPAPKPKGESHSGPKNSKGWDGKLRVAKSAVLANPEALSDPEYSDDDNIMEGEEIEPDEGAQFQIERLYVWIQIKKADVCNC